MAEGNRVERLLALLLVNAMKGASQHDKIIQISLAGFTNYEIADLLGTTTAVVAQSLYSARRRGPASGRTKTRKKVSRKIR